MQFKVLLLTPDGEFARSLEKQFFRCDAVEVAHFTGPETIGLSSHMDLSAYTITVIEADFAGDVLKTCRWIHEFRRQNRNPIYTVIEGGSTNDFNSLQLAGSTYVVEDKKHRAANHIPDTSRHAIKLLERIFEPEPA